MGHRGFKAKDHIAVKLFVPSEQGDDEIEVYFPVERIVCPNCNGTGTMVNPSVDGNGITESDWDEWHPDEIDDYFNGVYDVCCDECKGRNVVDEIDEERAAREMPEEWVLYMEQMREEGEYQMTCAAERRMGA